VNCGLATKLSDRLAPPAHGLNAVRRAIATPAARLGDASRPRPGLGRLVPTIVSVVWHHHDIFV
jgi:hypothetical protein